MSDDVLVVLQQAITREEDRHAFYAQATSRACNPLAKRTFEFLAADELRHKQYIEAYYDKMRATAQWPSPQECGPACQLEAADVKNLLAQARADLPATLTCDSELTGVYNLAMQGERDSINFYSDKLVEATADEAKHFYELLLEAERKHLRLLTNTQDYLEDTEKWYFEEEQWIVEG